MGVFVEAKLRRKDPESFQRRITEVIQLEPRNRIHPANSLVEDSEMGQASDTTAADHLCPTFVAKLTKPFHVVEKAQRE